MRGLEPLVEVNRQRHPHIDDSGHVDFHDLGSIPAVAAGDPVMRRHPPQPGAPGLNVLGEKLAAANGRDVQFAVRLQGVAQSRRPESASRRDGRSTASAAGRDLGRTDFWTRSTCPSSNIDFPGSLVVRGDIRSGMRVHAGGDIAVQGVIESAHVSAGGDIRVQVRSWATRPRSTACSALRTTWQPHTSPGTGNVNARYIENAVVEAQQSVYVLNR